jgi:hypothetical protein
VTVTALSGQGIVVECSMYGNPDWSLGTSSVGTAARGTTWEVPESSLGGFDTYFL